MSDNPSDVTRHYGGSKLRERIERALAEAGMAGGGLTTRDLAPLDEFHSRGRRATRELSQLAAPQAHEQVLDVGCGIGGPARYLAETFGCRVTGVDLTPGFCEVATWLTELTSLSGRVTVRQGSGTALPFEDGSFDLAWTIQMQMNIRDKDRLYSEIHRVLRPGGRYVLQELCAGDGGECHLPAPWASHDGISFLVSPSSLRDAVEGVGFTGESWRDTTDDALTWYEEQNAKAAAASPSPLGIHLVMGEQAAQKRANVERNYREGRLRQVMGSFRKRG